MFIPEKLSRLGLDVEKTFRKDDDKNRMTEVVIMRYQENGKMGSRRRRMELGEMQSCKYVVVVGVGAKPMKNVWAGFSLTHEVNGTLVSADAKRRLLCNTST